MFYCRVAIGNCSLNVTQRSTSLTTIVVKNSEFGFAQTRRRWGFGFLAKLAYDLGIGLLLLKNRPDISNRAWRRDKRGRLRQTQHRDKCDEPNTRKYADEDSRSDEVKQI
jgi:hypothetical protein